MKILLFSPPLVHPRLFRDTMRISPPLAIYHLGSLLIQAGYDVTIHDPHFTSQFYKNSWEESEIENLITGYDIIGISANSFNWAMAREFIEIIKSKKNAPVIVAGGVHASLFHEHIMQSTDVDFIIREDGEIALIKLINAIESAIPLDNIPNLTYRLNGRIVINDIYLEKNLTEILPAYNLIPDDYYYSLPVETSRGCPFDCIFCAILYLRSWRSVDVPCALNRITQALPYLNNKTTANSILFTDDEFNINTQRSKLLLNALEEMDTNFKCHLTARVTDFLKDEELITAVPRSKISTIQMGLECGYQEGLERVHKGLSLDDIESCLKKLSKADLSKYCLLSFIVGFPWEKKENCVKTIEYALSVEEEYNAVTTVNWWMPLKSRLWDEQAKNDTYIDAGIYDDPLWPANEKVLNLVHPEISIKEIYQLTSQYGDFISHLLDMV